MIQPMKILLLEDQLLDAELIKRELIKGKLDFELLVVGTKSKFAQALIDFPADIILSDHSLPDFDSHEALEMIKLSGILVPFILITAAMTDEFAVTAMQAGADDYIIKDRLRRLPSAISNLVEKFKVREEQQQERFQLGEEMKYMNHRLLLATRSANIGVWDWDLVAQRLEWDDSMHEIYHVKPGRMDSVYETWLNRLHSDDRATVDQQVKDAISGDRKYDTQFRIIIDDGSVHHIRATGIVEHDQSGKPVRMIGINWDITPRVSANLEREQIIEEMMHRNTALEQFAYIISHNLRAPIANIIGSTDLMADANLAVDDQRVLLRAINESVLKLDNIVKDLNTILEVSAENYKHHAMVDFASLVDDIKSSIIDVVELNHIQIAYDFTSCSGILSLKPYLQSIFYNLITNSIKYRRKDIPCAIHILSERNNNTVRLTFSDNGTGIDMKKNAEHIFGLYKRFNTEVDGKGMGLFMVKTQVEKLGGKISVNSEEGVQTEFTITFNL